VSRSAVFSATWRQDCALAMSRSTPSQAMTIARRSRRWSRRSRHT